MFRNLQWVLCLFVVALCGCAPAGGKMVSGASQAVVTSDSGPCAEDLLQGADCGKAQQMSTQAEDEEEDCGCNE